MTNIGIIARVAGVVVDVEFPSGDLPGIRNALTITRQNDEPLIVVVQEHIDPYTVRTVAMDTTSGLSRGLPVHDAGGPVRVPVGRATLGRMFNVLGQPIDDQPDLGDCPSGRSMPSRRPCAIKKWRQSHW